MSNPPKKLFNYENRPWPERRARELVALNTFKEKFETYHPQNRNLDYETKTSALKVSPSVVGIGCISLDGRFHFSCSGTIVKSAHLNPTTYLNTIITSASLFGGSSHKNFKAEVYLGNGKIFKVKDFDYDNHFNVALLKFESDTPMPIATLRFLDDSCNTASRSFEIRPHSEAFHISHGDKVIAVGRYFNQPFDLMAAPGKYVERCNFECQQLLHATCNISKCGIGGPLVNVNGEVIGINFYHEKYTPFLPVNVAMKCLENLDKFGKFIRPCFGIKAANVSVATSLANLEKIMQRFPNHPRGVLVEEVVPESSADHAGIRQGDRIVECDGKTIKSLLQFDTMLLDKVGKCVEVHVARRKDSTLLKINVLVDETSPENFYSWPIPKKRWVEKY